MVSRWSPDGAIGLVDLFLQMGLGRTGDPDEVSVSPIVSNWSYLTTFIKGSCPRNGSNYVKTVDVLIPSKWGCRGQEVSDGTSVSLSDLYLLVISNLYLTTWWSFCESHSVTWVMTDNFYLKGLLQKWL